MAFYTGMRHMQPKADLITKTRKLINAGLMKEAPAWLTALERLPPQVTPPREYRGVPKIVLPTDRLFHVRQVRNPGSANEPLYSRGEVQSATLLFAQRQWELMSKEGMAEDEAYKAVEKQMAAQRESALEQVKELTREVRAEGADAMMAVSLSGGGGDGVQSQLLAWQERLRDAPWGSWELGQQVMLDHWVCKTALSWGWEEERYLHEEKFELELARLRRALFGASVPDPDAGGAAARGSGASADDDEDASVANLMEREAEELEALVEAQDWDDPVLSDEINAWYVAFGKWQTKAFQRGDFAAWPTADREGLDLWILQNCLPKDALAGLDDDDAATALAAARFQLLPRLDPDEAGNNKSFADVLPDLRDVQRMLVFKRKGEMQKGGAAADQIEQVELANSPDTGHEPSSGLRAVQQMERAGGASSSSSSSSSAAAALKGLPSSPGSARRPDALDAAIAEREAEEAAMVVAARREETWKARLAAHERIISKSDEEAYKRLAAEALSWAIPSLEAKKINAQFLGGGGEEGAEEGEKSDDAPDSPEETKEGQKGVGAIVK